MSILHQLLTYCRLRVLCTSCDFRSTPCSLVKPDEEWGELSACEAGEHCGSSHTRTEQQFHPEVEISAAN